MPGVPRPGHPRLSFPSSSLGEKAAARQRTRGTPHAGPQPRRHRVVAGGAALGPLAAGSELRSSPAAPTRTPLAAAARVRRGRRLGPSLLAYRPRAGCACPLGAALSAPLHSRGGSGGDSSPGPAGRAAPGGAAVKGKERFEVGYRLSPVLLALFIIVLDYYCCCYCYYLLLPDSPSHASIQRLHSCLWSPRTEVLDSPIHLQGGQSAEARITLGWRLTVAVLAG